ncbi:MAG: Cytochrome P450-like [Ramlibacter sp.]|nr:Cytochrome P450-like [Ramlibacter sp.]
MLTLKYYAAIEQAQRKTTITETIQAFDLDQLGADGWRRRASLWLRDRLFVAALALFRAIWPNPKFFRLVIVTRASDVKDVLKNPDAFEVPYGREMTELAGGENFVLGMEGDKHDRQNAIIRAVMKQDDAQLVADLSRHFANSLIRMSGGRIDVMKDYITRVATETCARYFGLQLDDPDAFAVWAMSISALLFADPFGDAATRQLAINGSARIRAVIDRSVANRYRAPDTVLSRLIALKNSRGVTDGEIRAIMIGLVTGLIPTNTLAAGKILQELLRRPDALQEAKERARNARTIDEVNRGRTEKTENKEKQELQAILFEAARLNPALAPGQWRYARQDAVIASGTSRQRTVPKGSVLMVSTMSALRDGRAIQFPGQFRADRAPSSTDLMFGDFTHECLGKHLAMAQITEIFMILLSQTDLRLPKWSPFRWRGIRWVGPFPRWLDMEFDPAVSPATQNMLTICAPLKQGVDCGAIEKQIAALGNPAGRTMRSILDATGIVHFASLSLIEAGDANEPAPHLLLELNVDGATDAAIRKVASAAGNELGPIFQNTPLGGSPLAEILGGQVLDLKTQPWGAIGLNFNGTEEFSVPNIEMQASLSAFASDVLDYFLTLHQGIGSRAMEALNFVRTFIRQRQRFEAAAAQMPAGDDQKKLQDLLDRGAKFAHFLIVPSRRQLQISEWTQCTKGQALAKFLKTQAFWYLAIPVIVVTLLLGATIYCAIDAATWIGLAGRILFTAIGALAASTFLLALVAASFLWLLRRHENRDIPDDQNPKLSDIEKIARFEDFPGFAQNHFMAVTPLKPGWFRKFALALSLWGIKQLALNLFRPGFVLNMGTIHYAKWFRLPGRDKLIFQANYDGSWESYLEDFIMKAHWGQSAAWSNGVGFPRTRFLVFDGARDGDRFKRWVRRQQVVARFWYTRFCHLTTDQIRTNALIHDGLARASTDSEARAWLDCFGSIPRPDYAIEANEVQSLVFRGLRTLPYVACALVRLPSEASARAAWLQKLVKGAENPAEHGSVPLYDRDNPCLITFGDHPFSTDPEMRKEATFVGFTAAGLAKLGVPGPENQDGLATFQNAFNMGMANRSRILGDFGTSAPQQWRWSGQGCVENPEAGTRAETQADAIILIYGKSRERCINMLNAHAEKLGGEERAFVHVTLTEPTDEGIDYEHFGFRDGISQPVIRGTQRFSKGAPTRDIVEPGEFILGYRNNQNYYPPTAVVRADTDLATRLPTVLASVPSRFPSFENGDSALRDFGRNGSFLVVRQLAQDVKGFREFTDTKAQSLSQYDGKWVAAKLMGRWQDGTPLVVSPGAQRDDDSDQDDRPENDFSYATDDPQGLHCPFGAHIRRANPRDSLQPEDPDQQLITSRHRLLRRGRTYEYESARDSEPHQGLMFTSLCADLERQFEFVQQTWIGSPAFHGLKDEADPIAASQDPKAGVFTIPTPLGPLRLHDMQSFVTVRGGGYFFLPSLSAMLYLFDRNQG